MYKKNLTILNIFLLSLIIKLIFAYFFLKKEIMFPDSVHYFELVHSNPKNLNFFNISFFISKSATLHFIPFYLDSLIYKFLKIDFLILAIKIFLVNFSCVIWMKNFEIIVRRRGLFFLILLLFSPKLLLFSIFNLKDQYVFFFFTVGIYIVLKIKKFRILKLILTIIFSFFF